jgi:hypothetical protein
MKQTHYVPKPVRGCSCKGHIRINRRQLARLFQNPDWRFSGFIVGNNVNPFHFFGGWYLACRLENKTSEEMTKAINSFCFYLDAELGSDAAIFVAKSAISQPEAVAA